MSYIAKTAIVSAKANLHKDVTVKDYAIIGDDVSIDAHSVIEAHASINGPTTIGKNNQIFSFASVGGDPQDISYQHGDKSTLIIGDNNVIREFCTINRGTEKECGITRIGSDNLLMAYTHIAHDCQIGNHIIMSNNASLAGHVKLHDYVILGGFTLVKQFCTIGEYCYIGMGSKINKDIPPFLIASDTPTRIRTINREGLTRQHFSTTRIATIKRAFKAVYRQPSALLDPILTQLEQDEANSKDVIYFVNFIRQSKLGIMLTDNNH